MEVTIDKFGRILIPKRIRQLLGLSPGQTLELIPDKDNQKLAIKVSAWTDNLKIEHTASGFPVIQAGNAEEVDFDTKTFIKQTQEHYLDRKAGLV